MTQEERDKIIDEMEMTILEERMQFIDDSVDIGKEPLTITDEKLKKQLEDLMNEFNHKPRAE